jgi:hypothetical protein
MNEIVPFSSKIRKHIFEKVNQKAIVTDAPRPFSRHLYDYRMYDLSLGSYTMDRHMGREPSTGARGYRADQLDCQSAGS